MEKYTYNDQLKVAIPTIDYIKEMTGRDLVILEGNSQLAEAKVKGLTIKAKNYLYHLKTRETQTVLNFKIKTDEKYRNDFLNYAIAYIESSMFSDIDFVYGKDKPPFSVLQAITGSLLSIDRFTSNVVVEARQHDENI